ncbi:hypothetical protein EB796_004831 [Bugula neritina]|uniref:Uncharacterized protein n=1 Tax=Bugula neritina TaxID=10212 RepID=A0A7J7KF61_BUGNE|nr:hypothetical protein EB796_004831 [Bugula neritina]
MQAHTQVKILTQCNKQNLNYHYKQLQCSLSINSSSLFGCGLLASVLSNPLHFRSAFSAVDYNTFLTRFSRFIPNCLQQHPFV